MPTDLTCWHIETPQTYIRTSYYYRDNKKYITLLTVYSSPVQKAVQLLQTFVTGLWLFLEGLKWFKMQYTGVTGFYTDLK